MHRNGGREAYQRGADLNGVDSMDDDLRRGDAWYQREADLIGIDSTDDDLRRRGHGISARLISTESTIRTMIFEGERHGISARLISTASLAWNRSIDSFDSDSFGFVLDKGSSGSPTKDKGNI